MARLSADEPIAAAFQPKLDQNIMLFVRLVRHIGLPVGPASMVDAVDAALVVGCLLYTSPSPRDRQKSRMPSSA